MGKRACNVLQRLAILAFSTARRKPYRVLTSAVPVCWAFKIAIPIPCENLVGFLPRSLDSCCVSCRFFSMCIKS